MDQICEIMNTIIDNFDTIKIMIQTESGNIIRSTICPISFKQKNNLLYLYDGQTNEISLAINCDDAEIVDDTITIYGNDYVITMEW